jgi:membrane protein DedA with SNARE-associated domain
VHLRKTVQSRPALLIFTARYIPFARIAVNLSIGAARLPLARYLPLAAAAGLFWALYNIAIGTVFGNVFRDQPLLAILFSTVVAIALGLLVDRSISAIRAWRHRRARRDEESRRPAA